MRWQGRRESENVQDVGGSGDGGGLGGGMGGGFGGRGPFIVRRAGGGGIGAIIVVLVLAYFLGINPLDLLNGNISGVPGQSGQQATSTTSTADENQMHAFVATVLADTEDAWTDILSKQGKSYPKPTLKLFHGSVQSACGNASESSGPFYCPNDQSVYIDLNFYDELKQRFGAPGDFAEAYVLAHEVGHHVQNVLGILPDVHRQEAAASETEANALSVKTELQADCFAGIWAKHTEKEGILDPGDVDEALTAAAAVGDDTLQKQSQGYVVPDSFTHGSAAQRTEWFKRGYDKGEISGCDTFASGS